MKSVGSQTWRCEIAPHSRDPCELTSSEKSANGPALTPSPLAVSFAVFTTRFSSSCSAISTTNRGKTAVMAKTCCGDIVCSSEPEK